ncbi:MAG: hypothetical protein KAI43_04210 [Candidatus Aureabacteria bacterium]|nr:hypothetical protein [Candidatus Auribacterota bacterium]
MFYKRDSYNKKLIVFIVILLLLFSFAIEKYHSHKDHKDKENCPVCSFKIASTVNIVVCLIVFYSELSFKFILPENCFIPYKTIILFSHHLRSPPLAP